MLKCIVPFIARFYKLDNGSGRLKGTANLTHIVLQSKELQKLCIDTNLIKIGQELRKLWTIEYLNINGYGRRHFEYLMRLHKSLKFYFL